MCQMLAVPTNYLDTPALVMDIVITGIVRRDLLQRIKWQSIAAMIIDSLDRRAREKPHALTRAHSR